MTFLDFDWAAARRAISFDGADDFLGHYRWTFHDPLFRVLWLRGMAWTIREPLGRFNALATDGVELAE